jgi:hypothetical protein
MKRNIILTAAVMFIACMFTGCASDITEGTASKEYTLTGSMGQLTDANATRMAYDGNTNLEGIFKWEIGDRIDVWDATGKYIGTMSLSTGKGNNDGTFTGSLYGTPKYVTYPASATALTVGTSTSTTINSVPTGHLTSEQHAYSLSDLKSAQNFIFAQAEINNNNFTLNHRFAYIYVNITLNATRSDYTHAYITGTNIASTSRSYTMNPMTGALTATGWEGLNVWETPSVMPIPEGATMSDMGLYGPNGSRFFTVPSERRVSNAVGGCIYQYTGTFGEDDPYVFSISSTEYTVPATLTNITTQDAAGVIVTSTKNGVAQPWEINEISNAPITSTLSSFGSSMTNTSGNQIQNMFPWNHDGTNGTSLSLEIQPNTSTSSRVFYARLRQKDSNKTIIVKVTQAGASSVTPTGTTTIALRADRFYATADNFLYAHEYTVKFSSGKALMTVHKAANSSNWTVVSGATANLGSYTLTRTLSNFGTNGLKINGTCPTDAAGAIWTNPAYSSYFFFFNITDNTTSKSVSGSATADVTV